MNLPSYPPEIRTAITRADQVQRLPDFFTEPERELAAAVVYFRDRDTVPLEPGQRFEGKVLGIPLVTDPTVPPGIVRIRP